MVNSNLDKKNLYGLELREKFMEICRADLVSRVLNQTNNNLMLLRTHRITLNNIGKTYFVYNGLKKVSLTITDVMLGFKVGEFVLTKRIKNMSASFSHMKNALKLRDKKKSKGKKRKQQLEFIINIKNTLVNLKKNIRKINLNSDNIRVNN